jgi:hypothetical protein
LPPAFTLVSFSAYSSTLKMEATRNWKGFERKRHSLIDILWFCAAVSTFECRVCVCVCVCVCLSVQRTTSWDSFVGIAKGYGLHGQGSIPDRGRPTLGPIQPIQWVSGALSPKV